MTKEWLANSPDYRIQMDQRIHDLKTILAQMKRVTGRELLSQLHKQDQGQKKPASSPIPKAG
jgi:hypothetical protein